MSSCEGRGVRCLVCGIGWAHAVRPSVVWMGGWDEQLRTQSLDVRRKELAGK